MLVVIVVKIELERKKSYKVYKDCFYFMWLIIERLNIFCKNKIVVYFDFGDILFCNNERKGSFKCSNLMLYFIIKGDFSI